MAEGFSMTAFLRAQTPQRIAAMQGQLECIKRFISYWPECSSSEDQRACLERRIETPDAMDFLIASLVRFSHHPEENFGTTVSEYWGDARVDLATAPRAKFLRGSRDEAPGGRS